MVNCQSEESVIILMRFPPPLIIMKIYFHKNAVFMKVCLFLCDFFCIEA